MNENQRALTSAAATADYIDLKATAVRMYDLVHTLNKSGAWDKFTATYQLMFEAVRAAYELGYKAAEADRFSGNRRLDEVMAEEF